MKKAIIILCFLLAACGRKEDQKTGDSTPTVSRATETAHAVSETTIQFFLVNCSFDAIELTKHLPLQVQSTVASTYCGCISGDFVRKMTDREFSDLLNSKKNIPVYVHENDLSPSCEFFLNLQT